MKKNNNFKRIESLIKYKVHIIILNNFNNFKIKYFSITRVKLLLDYSEIKIYILYFNSEKFKEKIYLLNKSSNFIRKKLFKLLNIKYIPKIIFKYDFYIEKTINLINIINNINK